MPVPTDISQLTTSEATNSPLDSESITATTRPSDYLRAHAAIIKTLESSKQASDATLNAIADGSMGAFSHRNKIINGGFSVNQRAYVSGAATTAGQYTLDRWKVTGTGGVTFSTTANKTTVTIPSGQAFQQVIEGLNLQSGTYVMSWEGTAQAKIGAGSLGASGITGSITGGTDTTIEFGPGTVANVQLEFGSVATPFEHRLYGIELALCRRYTRTFFRRLAFATGSAGIVANIAFDPPMRDTPIVSGPSTLYWENQVYAVAGSATGLTYGTAHMNYLGGPLLISGTFSPAPTYGQMSEINLSGVVFSAEL